MFAALARSDIKLWFLAIRPLTLPMSATPVLVGAVLALAQENRLDWVVLMATLTAAICIQAGTNLLNDAEDYRRGNDTANRRGPPRITAKGWASVGEVRSAATLSFLLAGVAGLYLVAHGGWPIFWIGVGSILAGTAYSAGSTPISHTPLGELFVFVFFGILALAGTFYLQTGYWSSAALVFGSAMGSYAAAVLHTNNARDIVEDKKAGRRTLAIAISECGQTEGRFSSRFWLASIYGLFILAPYVLIGLHGHFSGFFAGRQMLWFTMLSLPGAVLAIRCFFAATSGSQSNRLLVMTIGLQLMFATLLCIGLLV